MLPPKLIVFVDKVMDIMSTIQKNSGPSFTPTALDAFHTTGLQDLMNLIRKTELTSRPPYVLAPTLFLKVTPGFVLKFYLLLTCLCLQAVSILDILYIYPAHTGENQLGSYFTHE